MRSSQPLRILAAFALLVVSALPAAAQRPDSATRAATAAATQADHARMMAVLGIESIRPGPSGNPQAPNAANNDESRVPPYTLPDPLILEDGTPVATSQQWWEQRRPEIAELFDREIYGRMPDNVPGVRWEVAGTARERNGDHEVLVRNLVGRVDNSAHPAIEVSIDLTLVTPADAPGPVPVMLNFGFNFPAGARPPGAAPTPGRRRSTPADRSISVEVWPGDV